MSLQPPDKYLPTIYGFDSEFESVQQGHPNERIGSDRVYADNGFP
ncbi:MAG TPA: hypothetical protein VKU00_06985 [Chthonomonadaceae bacterium]|nr:hypothetical protein [Chthonomonadaceae bacterium]